MLFGIFFYQLSSKYYRMRTSNLNADQWADLSDSFKKEDFSVQTSKIFIHPPYNILLNIELDPGGGFESGFEFTSLSADIPVQFTSFSSEIQKGNGFSFSIYKEHFTDKIGKLFGMEDVISGFEEFDKKFIIKTNNTERLKKLLLDEQLRNFLIRNEDAVLNLKPEPESVDGFTLELEFDKAITDIQLLKELYNEFTVVLDHIAEKK